MALTSWSINDETKEGEIWLVEYEPQRGAEIQKTRPAVVLSIKEIGRK
jgi:mRNA-degrading endonuclease toxin of MazEF toxin-antitoxin module